MASQAKAGKAAKAKTGTRQKDNSKASKAHKDALAARIRASLLAGDPPLSDGEMDVVTDYILAAAHDRDLRRNSSLGVVVEALHDIAREPGLDERFF